MPSAHSRRGVLVLLGAALVTGCSERSDGPTDSQPSSPTQTPASTTTTTQPTIDAPADALQDEPLGIHLTGFPAQTAVTVEARVDDSRGRTWSATATFETNDQGAVVVPDQRPRSGSYDHADGMGLIWSMTPADDRVTWFATTTASNTLQLTAGHDGSTLATHEVTRRYVAEGVTETSATDNDTDSLFVPPGDGPHPPVLVLHGSGGRPWVTMARMLATHGYAAFAANYFGGGPDVPDELVEVPLEQFQFFMDWLRERDDVLDAPVGVVGASKGGEAAALIATHLDGVAAAVPYVGTGVVFQGSVVEPASSWSYEGDPLPFVPYLHPEDAFDGNGPDRGWLAEHEASLAAVSDERLANATIPVEDADAPFLFVSGERDGVWPSTRLSDVAIDRLDAAGYDHGYEHLAYPEAGHGIHVPYLPTEPRTGPYFGGTPAGTAAAMADSWPRVLSFLDDHVARE